MPRHRILQLTSTSDLGGAERMVQALAEGLDPSRYEVHVGSLIGCGELIHRAEAAGLPSVHFHFSNAMDAAGIQRFVHYVRSQQINLVQTHGLRADGIARWAARLGGVRSVLSTIHSVDPWRRTPHILLDQLTAPLVSRFVAVCEAAKAATVARERISPGRIDVIPIGIKPPLVPRDRREEIRQQLRLTDAHFPTIGILANLREMKGHRYVIEALSELREKLPGITFLFAGRDDSNGQLQKYAREQGAADSIRFLGFVQDTPALLAAMDIFMLPSDWEGLPVSVIEALHSALPIIATRVGGIPEIVRDNVEGLLIEPRSPQAIVQAVLRMTNDWAARARFARAAELRAQSEFSYDTMLHRYDNLYTGLLDQSSSG